MRANCPNCRTGATLWYFMLLVFINLRKWISKVVRLSKLCFSFPWIFVVLIELLFQLRSVGELLPIIFINFLPYISELIAETLLKSISVYIKPLIVESQIAEFKQTLYLLYLIFYSGLLLFYFFLKFFSFGKIDQIHNHVCEIMWQVSFA